MPQLISSPTHFNCFRRIQIFHVVVIILHLAQQHQQWRATDKNLCRRSSTRLRYLHFSLFHGNLSRAGAVSFLSSYSDRHPHTYTQRKFGRYYIIYILYSVPLSFFCLPLWTLENLALLCVLVFDDHLLGYKQFGTEPARSPSAPLCSLAICKVTHHLRPPSKHIPPRPVAYQWALEQSRERHDCCRLLLVYFLHGEATPN